MIRAGANEDHRESVLIAGAGAVGLTLACELERHGVDVRIVDGARPTAVSRATDLHARSLELWDHTGVADAIMAAALPITGVPLFSGDREVARLDFAGVDSDFPAAVSLRERDLEALLRERLRGQVQWRSPVRHVGEDDDWVIADVGGEEVRTRFLVACDGVHSSLRDAVGIPFDGDDYPGRWAVMDVRVEHWPYDRGEIPVFMDEEGFWAMPLPGGQLRLFFRDDTAGVQPEVADAQAVLDRHVPGSPMICEAENAACFSLSHRIARRFRAGRVFLAGDAAHVMTPVSGQGMNTGVQDAYNLAWKLRVALDSSDAADVLDSYDSERRPVAAATMRSCGDVHEANMLTGVAAAQRDRALADALETPAQVLAAVESGHELRVAYPPSKVVAGCVREDAAGVVPGQRIPPAGPLVSGNGSTTTLREILRSPAVQLWLCVGVGAAEPAMRLAQRFGESVLVRLFTTSNDTWLRRTSPEVFLDADSRVHDRLGASAPAAYVVRPDGYLAARCEPPDADWLADHLRLLLGDIRRVRLSPH